MLGPREFVKGMGRGGRGFVTGVLHGVSSSVAGVATAVNRNLAALTFDDDYRWHERQKDIEVAWTKHVTF